MDGTLTDRQVAIANKITANKYDNVSTTNIVTNRDKCVYINNDMLSDMEMEKEKENRSIIDIILEWLFTSYYEKKHDKRKKELLDEYDSIVDYTGGMYNAEYIMNYWNQYTKAIS